METNRDLTIAEQASKCLTLFERLLESQNEQELPKNQISEDAIRHAQARFRTWIESIGALQSGEASLDHRLQQADIRYAILKVLKQLCSDLDDLWQIFSGARTQQTRTLLDDVASLDFSNIEGSDDENDGDDFPQLAELLVEHEADTEKLKINRQVGVRNVQRAQERATSTKDTSIKDNASLQGTKEDCIEMEALSPLHGAALQGDLESIKAALEAGADIEGFSPDGATPLTLAASKGHHDAIKQLQLVCNGADMTFLSPDRWTALTEASYQGQKEIMRILVQCGANTESRSAYDRTPLMHASYNGDEAAVMLLLEAGSNTEATSAHGETAMSLAAGGGYTNIVRMLLMYGCVPEPAWAKDQKDSSKEGSQKAKAEETGEPEDKVLARGFTPLMHASQGGHVEIGRILLERNVNTEARSPHGKTALEIAKENGRIDMASILEFARHKMSTTP